jgi:hypothetical protein
MFVATHSPVILSCARPEDILCFKKSEDGATDIVHGNEHPAVIVNREIFYDHSQTGINMPW